MFTCSRKLFIVDCKLMQKLWSHGRVRGEVRNVVIYQCCGVRPGAVARSMASQAPLHCIQARSVRAQWSGATTLTDCTLPSGVHPAPCSVRGSLLAVSSGGICFYSPPPFLPQISCRVKGGTKTLRTGVLVIFLQVLY